MVDRDFDLRRFLPPLLTLFLLGFAPGVSAGTFSPAGDMTRARYWHTATLLADGKVLITGGNDDWGPLPAAELYDPNTGKFEVITGMNAPRDIHTATLLADGTVLIAGGGDGWMGASTLAGVEIYDPESGTFRDAGRMSTMRSGHTATRLLDGRVLFAGGFQYWPFLTLASTETYEPDGR